MTDIIDRSEAERILGDPGFTVPEADAAATRPADRFRALASRFTNGARHDERRARLEELLANLDPDALAATATARTTAMAGAGVDEIAAHVPVACLAEHLRFADPESMPALAAEVAGHYPTGGASAAADAAIVRLLAAAPRVGASDDDETAALQVQLLVQAYAATAALIVGAMRLASEVAASVQTAELLAETLRDAPPVPVTRRLSPGGELLVLHLGGPDPDTALHDPPRTLAFGAGPRSCPAPRHALAMAAAIVDGLRAC